MTTPDIDDDSPGPLIVNYQTGDMHWFDLFAETEAETLIPVKEGPVDFEDLFVGRAA